MTRLLIATSCRNVPPEERSGFFYVFDSDSKAIIQRGDCIEPPFRKVDPNPRGGFRGAKGITGNADLILISSASCIYVYDKQWNLVNTISHPSCSGIHEIHLDSENRLWVTSTRNDILFAFDLNGELLEFNYLRKEKVLRENLDWNRPIIITDSMIESGKIDFRDPRTHEIAKYDAAHLNSVVSHPDGGLLISLGLVVGGKFWGLIQIKYWLLKLGLWKFVVAFNRLLLRMMRRSKDMHSDLVVQPAKGKSVVARMNDGVVEPVLVLEGQHVPSHSIITAPDGTAFYLNTAPGDLIHFRLDTGKIISQTHVTDKFLRGAYLLSDEVILLGSQSTLIYFDFVQCEVLDRIELSDNKLENVFDIKELPESFSLPPKSFEAILGKPIGFDGHKPLFENS